MQSHALSILVPTRNRSKQLASMLCSFAGQNVRRPWELIVIDNGSTDETPSVLRDFRTKLPLKILTEPTPGKSRALNRALNACSGDLVAFTDDDVTVSPSWVDIIIRAAAKYPDYGAFCGPIDPVFPSGTPMWLRGHPFAAAAFASFRQNLPAGLLPPPAIPFGPNFAVRGRLIRNSVFREDLGPSHRGPLMCEDTEFAARFRTRGVSFCYLPGAPVAHHIREELTALDGLYQRAYYLGFSFVRATGLAMTPPFEVNAAGEPHIARFESGCLMNLYYGGLFSLLERGDTERASQLLPRIAAVSSPDARTLLCPPAAEGVRKYRPIIPAATC